VAISNPFASTPIPNATLLIKGVQSGPPVDNIRLCGHFAASFMCEIICNGDKLISNQV